MRLMLFYWCCSHGNRRILSHTPHNRARGTIQAHTQVDRGPGPIAWRCSEICHTSQILKVQLVKILCLDVASFYTLKKFLWTAAVYPCHILSFTALCFAFCRSCLHNVAPNTGLLSEQNSCDCKIAVTRDHQIIMKSANRWNLIDSQLSDVERDCI